MSYSVSYSDGTRVVHALADVERAAVGGRIEGIVIPFNGVLVTRDLVERIGVPRA